MRIDSIQRSMGVLLGALFILVLISVAVNYWGIAAQKLVFLRWVQAGFLAAALGLLGLAIYWIRRSILKPLRELEAAAGRIGQGDLDTPVQSQGLQEIRELAETIEKTRLQLLHSQQELIAWGNTLEERVGQRTRELEVLYWVSKDISSRLDLQHVLSSVTEQAHRLLEAEVALLCLITEDKKALSLHSASGVAEAVVRSHSSVNETLPSLVLAGEGALSCGQDGCLGSCGIIAAPYRASHLAAPLRMGERVIGALCVGSSRGVAFSSEAQLLLTRLANSAAIAIENARLYDQAERLATLEERQRLAAELHDGMAQTINFLRLSVYQIEDLAQKGEHAQVRLAFGRLEQALNQLESELRRSIASLQDDIPRFYPLQQQLADLAEEMSGEGQRVRWETSLIVPLILSDDQAEQVLRVAREALLNARRHSHASTISLRLARDGGQAKVIVEDDGRGFDSQQAPAKDGGQRFGLKIMRARAARLGGQVEILSSPGQGARITLTWPIAGIPRPAKRGYKLHLATTSPEGRDEKH
jgi:two-component system nitrate/nitrite sensor histidine kinase NarX